MDFGNALKTTVSGTETVTSEQKGMLLGSTSPQNASADQQKKQKTQAQIMKWHLWAGTKLSGMAQKAGSNQDKPVFLLSEFTVAPIVQRSAATEQLLQTGKRSHVLL